MVRFKVETLLMLQSQGLELSTKVNPIPNIGINTDTITSFIKWQNVS